MRKYVVVSIVLVLTYIITGAYCYKLGNINKIATYEEDKASCVRLCAPNDGVEDVSTRTMCSCQNGALFNEKDLRR